MHSGRGFVLIEVLIVLLISSVVVAAILGGLVALVRGLQPQDIVVNGEALPVAPTFGAFPSAVRLHEAFSNHVSAARATYVFGGRHLSIPANAPAAQLAPLKIQALPQIADFTAGLPMDAKSFYDTYADVLGDTEAAPNADDFSIIVIEPGDTGLTVGCLVQVRRTDVGISDGNARTDYTTREVKLWEPGTAEPLRYAYAERHGQTDPVFIGAVHTWMRFQLSPAQREEGPACVVFPDPWVYSGSRGQADDLPAFSRFSYFLAVSP